MTGTRDVKDDIHLVRVGPDGDVMCQYETPHGAVYFGHRLLQPAPWVKEFKIVYTEDSCAEVLP